MREDETDAGLAAALAPSMPAPEGSPEHEPPTAEATQDATGAQVAPDLIGAADRVSGSEIGGWVMRSRRPGDRCIVFLREGAQFLAWAKAATFRPDLYKAGIGDGAYGFTIPLPSTILDGREHLLELVEKDSERSLTAKPIRWRARATPEAVAGAVTPPRDGAHSRHTSLPQVSPVPDSAPFRSFVDSVNEVDIHGWIWVPSRPTRRCNVLLKKGDRVLAQTTASIFRRDLLDAGIGDGSYGFRIIQPKDVLDGKHHLLDLVEEETGLSLTKEPIRWRHESATVSPDEAGTSRSQRPIRWPDVEVLNLGREPRRLQRDRPATGGSAIQPSLAAGTDEPRAPCIGTRVMFDISDLVTYIAFHPNLTGIQRVQSSIVLSILNHSLIPIANLVFLSFNAADGRWLSIPPKFVQELLEDLFRPEHRRTVRFPAEEARRGMLPGALPFDGTGVLDDGNPSAFCLLGAAWDFKDYLFRVQDLKRRFGTRFVMTVHDLVPIFARETCDQDTVRVFEEFMLRALRHADSLLSVSENTARDLRRHLRTLRLPEPPITVTKNGSTFAEFLDGTETGTITLRDLPRRFVLFVATIEGRKNHRLVLEIWRRLVAEEKDPPHLICVGRLGWKSSAFVSAVIESNYLDGRIHLMREISDLDLRLLYERCLFTLCPSLYEGWGLPVGESLAHGKICVCSDRASVPEVAGEYGVYFDIDSVDNSLEVIRHLINDDEARGRLETKIRRDYVPVTWRSVAEKVAAACEAAVGREWQGPYPYASVPYSTEITFSRLNRETETKGELLLTRIVDARRGFFTNDVLDEASFLIGEEARATGTWSQPEEWGSWLCEGGGEIEFSLAPDPSALYYVFLRLRTSRWLDQHAVTLTVFGRKVWQAKVGVESRNAVLRVRKRGGPTEPWLLRIGAEIDVSPEMKQRIASVDRRIPTIGFERLIVVPERDIDTRLEILTTLMV